MAIEYGNGTLTYKDGSKYVGEFINDEFNGQGTHTKSDGEKYEGQFAKGLYNGQGTYTFTRWKTEQR